MARMFMSRIREFREARGMTQDTLAEHLGVSRQTVVAIEKGNYTPSVALALEAAKIFQTQVEGLFYWK